jgi:hypothetical protein
MESNPKDYDGSEFNSSEEEQRSIEETQPAAVENDDRADYYLILLKSKQKEVERLQGRAEVIQKDIETEKRSMGYLKNQLNLYMAEMVGKDPKKKSHKLEDGILKARQGIDTVKVNRDLTDADYDKYADVVNMKVKYQADLKAIKIKLETSGEIPDFAEIVPGEIKYSVVLRLDEGREVTVE